VLLVHEGSSQWVTLPMDQQHSLLLLCSPPPPHLANPQGGLIMTNVGWNDWWLLFGMPTWRSCRESVMSSFTGRASWLVMECSVEWVWYSWREALMVLLVVEHYWQWASWAESSWVRQTAAML